MAHPEVLFTLSAALVFALCCATAAARAPEFESLGIEPQAFFPLVDGDLRSYPDAKYGGEIIWGRMLWDKDVLPPVNDDIFPGALSCVRRPDKVFHDGIFQRFPGTIVQLDNVPYGTQGDFSINLWMRHRLNQTRSDENALHGYLFSHAGEHVKENVAENPNSGWVWRPNQISVWVPSEGRPHFGLVRAVVKDADDEYLDKSSQSFLDSDGKFSDDEKRALPKNMSVMDGRWHMVTVTTLGEGKKGYRMYVDGVLAGEMPQADTFNFGLDTIESLVSDLFNGTDHSVEKAKERGFGARVDAGDILNITGKIHLCGRADRGEKRFFDGDLAHLSLWDQVLSETEVTEMFVAVMGRERLETRCAAARDTDLPATLMLLGFDEIDPCPFLDNETFAWSILGDVDLNGRSDFLPLFSKILGQSALGLELSDLMGERMIPSGRRLLVRQQGGRRSTSN